MDHNVDDTAAVHQYNYFPPDQDPSYGLAYNSITGFGSIPHGSTRTQMVPDMQHTYLNMQQQHYPGANVYNSPHVPLPVSSSPPPQSPEEMYEAALSPPLSGSDTSGDGAYNSSGANSPASSRGHSLVHRNPRHYNPAPSPTSSSQRSHRHSRSRSLESDEDDNMGHLAPNPFTHVPSGGEIQRDHPSIANNRKEATRRQRIEAEQRRRDELRDGYAKLKDALPSSNQKSSKVSLLERATNHIIQLEKDNKDLQRRIAELELDSQRLRELNEKISLSAEGTPSPEHAMGRPNSPRPDLVLPGHSLVSVRGQHLSSEHSSPSASEGGH